MENFDLIKYLAEGRLLKENNDKTFAGQLIDINELKAFKSFIISELDKIVKEQAKEGENLYGEPFDANKYEELKNSINSLTTIDDIGVIIEDYLYENVYEKEYEVEDFFKYIYKTFKKVYKKSNNEDEAKQNAIEKINQYIKNGSKGSLNLSNTLITSLPDNLKVEGALDIIRTKITSLPNNLQVRSLYAVNTPITSLPDDLKVSFVLDLAYTKITSLPNNIKVEYLYLHNTKINSLPKDLQVEKQLHISQTPLSKKYTIEEIRKMVPGVKGQIL